MSSLSIQDDNPDWEDHPYVPSSDAPHSWLERLQPWRQRLLSFSASPSPFSREAAAHPESELEEAVHAALRRPRDTEIISESEGFFHELDRRIALISVAGRFAAAIGVSAVAALFFVVMIPAARDLAGQTDGAPSGIIQSMKAALIEQPSAGEDAKPGLCELQTILGPPQSQPVITHAQSETLLQQFMQWREKPTLARNP
jgi:hypothetical protein